MFGVIVLTIFGELVLVIFGELVLVIFGELVAFELLPTEALSASPIRVLSGLLASVGSLLMVAGLPDRLVRLLTGIRDGDGMLVGEVGAMGDHKGRKEGDSHRR